MKISEIRVKKRLCGCTLINFVLQYASFINEQWREIVRYDLAHGFFHRDLIYPNGKKEKTIIEMHDIKTSATFAEHDIKDKWEFYKAKYLKRNKNDKQRKNTKRY